MRTILRGFRSAALSLVVATPVYAQSAGLQRLLDAELARFPGRAGIWVKHLTTGDSAGVRADEAFNSASVIKLSILALAFQMVDKHPLSPSDRITFTVSDAPAAEVFSRSHHAGLPI